MQTRSHRTRQSLVRAMAELIADGQPSDAGLVNICRKAGVSRGALYHHFPSTAMLAAEVHRQAHHQIVALMTEAFRQDATDASRRFLVSLVESLRTNKVVRAGMQLAGDGSFQQPWLRDEMLLMLHERITDTERHTAFRAEDLAELVVVVTAGLETLGRSDPKWWEPGSVNRLWAMLRLLFGALGTHTEPAPATPVAVSSAQLPEQLSSG
ncbi:TetR/AcrR family transcriptional regulator [Streptomyces sp. NPDC048420]|uniref:TetR/AcrR family transcriptional regulator n=1 Tax=Streptomyces sp. NPDC048420 TaxID=3155755 RepID=UPI003435AEAB